MENRRREKESFGGIKFESFTQGLKMVKKAKESGNLRE
jgi:hypothetical protein